MASYQAQDQGFRLIPFIQNKTNAISFFLASPYNDKPVLNFFIELEDYVTPDVFLDMLTVAVDSLMLDKTNMDVSRDS